MAGATLAPVESLAPSRVALRLRDLDHTLGIEQALIGIESRGRLVRRRQPARQLDPGQIDCDVGDVLVRHLAVVNVLDHGQILTRAVAKEQELLGDEGGRQSGQSRILTLLAALAILTVTAGAGFIDFLARIEICRLKWDPRKSVFISFRLAAAGGCGRPDGEDH